MTCSTFDSLNDNVITAQDQDIIDNISSCYHYNGSCGRRRISIKVKAVYSWLHHMNCRGTTASHAQSATLVEEEDLSMKSFQNWIEVEYIMMMNVYR